MAASSSTMTKIWAIPERNLNGILVETADSLVATQLINSGNLGNHELSNVVLDCRLIMLAGAWE